MKDRTIPSMQQIFVRCSPDRTLLSVLLSEAEQRLRDAGDSVTVILYGVTPKRREGFFLLEVAGEIPAVFHQWMEEDSRVLDYCIVERSEADGGSATNSARWHSRLPAVPQPGSFGDGGCVATGEQREEEQP